jgi:hypothetical protein
MAVKDPEFPGRYVIAIECDGASYHSSRSARDRDRLRQGVLESLGWRFHRIWSTDWFRDSRQEVVRAVAAIEAARLAANLDRPIEATIKHVTLPIIEREVESDSDSAVLAMAYRKAVLPRMVSSGYEIHEAPLDRLAILVKVISDIEAPVHEAEITKRLMESFGVSRAGSRITEKVVAALGHGHRAGMFHYMGGFVYADKTCSSSIRNRSSFESAIRKIEWVAPEELDAALLDSVKQGFSLSKDAAVSASLESLGFGRVTTNIGGAMNARIEDLLKRGELLLQDGKLVIA